MEEERLIELQTHLAHQQLELEQLTANVVAQQQEIGILRAAIAELQRQLRESAALRTEGAAGMIDPPPPHY